MITLLDASVLIALGDAGHDHEAAALRLFPALPASRHLTDLYLLGLAVKHGGRFATFDGSIDASLVSRGPAALHLIPQSEERGQTMTMS